MTEQKPIVMLDLNGTVHAYREGSRPGNDLYDPPTAGFADWASKVRKEFRIVVWPTHMNTPRDIVQIRRWMQHHGLVHLGIDVVPHPPRGLKLKIDDRSLYFTGNWDDFPVEKLREFHTWSGR